MGNWNEKGKNNDVNENNKNINSTMETGEQLKEYENLLLDGTKINSSEKFTENRIFLDLEISNIQLVEKDNVTKFTADVKNINSSKNGGFSIKIILLDKEEKEIAVIPGYIDSIDAEKTAQINTSITKDVVNAYDFRLEK